MRGTSFEHTALADMIEKYGEEPVVEMVRQTAKDLLTCGRGFIVPYR